MKHWHMVHNLIEGLPIDAVTTLNKLETANADIGFSFFGYERFEHEIFTLELAQIEALLGVVATNEDANNLQPAEVRDAVAAVAAHAEAPPISMDELPPVPVDKLEFNKLPETWKWLIATGWQNAHHVGQYLADHPDPLMGEKIAKVLSDRYEYLKSQSLPPGEIMTSLYELATGSGTGSITPARQIASQALLAFFFESRDIFEDKPEMTIQ